MTLKRYLAIALCVLMLMSATACTAKPTQNDTVPPVGDTSPIPTAQDATGSVFVGTWNVSSNNSIMEKLTFLKTGLLQVYFNESQLGGVFFDDGTNMTMYISQSVIEGTYTVEGDTITITTEDDVLVLTKA